MKQELRLQQNNKGLSLVELIVTILISSVVMLAVIGLLTTGLSLYKNVSVETLLQTESQAVCGRINELVQEAQEIKIESVTGNKVVALLTIEDSGQCWWYYVVWDSESDMLMLTKEAVSMDADGKVSYTPSGEDMETLLGNMLATPQKKKYMLAQYVAKFQLDKFGDDNKLYRLDITLSTEGKEFTASQFINVRSK